MKIDLEKYQKHNIEKIDSVSSGISIEKKHKAFIDKFNINLSALIRDVLDKLMQQESEGEKSNED